MDTELYLLTITFIGGETLRLHQTFDDLMETKRHLNTDNPNPLFKTVDRHSNGTVFAQHHINRNSILYTTMPEEYPAPELRRHQTLKEAREHMREHRQRYRSSLNLK